MSYGHDEGPVYYREIQKNAYLKRIPNETSGNKLIPLGHKKPPLKPMWTQFCVHNGRQPYLEQYPLAESPATMTHKPTWRACLKTARHVTASVKPHVGQEYDFLVDTDEGPVRMLAPDWESMQDWVLTLRTKLHELRVLSAGENVYCSPPAPPTPRAAARDPTSPLPPTPPHPPDRVPGIELTTPIVTPRPEPVIEPTPQPDPATEIDISSWEDTPSTSQEQNIEIRKSETNTKSVAKICGQNICLDDSILKRNTEPTDSDEEFFNEIDRISDSVENIDFDYKQTLMVTDRQGSEDGGEGDSDRQATNVTVIQVSNKGPPHTAIPILGSEVNVFDFNFQTPESNSKFVNIVNTEVNVNNENGYGTVFSKESDYGHLSLMTTVNVTREISTPAVTVTDVKVTETNGVYERLCLASTSNETLVAKVKNVDRSRKSSLPNLDSNGETTYECLFPNESSVRNANVTENSVRNATVTENSVRNATVTENSVRNATVTENSGRNATVTENSVRNATVTENSGRNATVTENSGRNATVTENSVRNATVTENSGRNATVTENSARNATVTVNNERRENDRSQVVNPVVANLSSNTRVIRSNVERSHSQNAYDTSPRMREHLYRRVQNNSPKREVKTDKTESTQPKPIWKRGLTELSLLTRLRGIGQGKRHDSPTRQEQEPIERSVTSPVKVVHRSRPEARADNTRRRSSSLSNGHPPGGGLIPLRRRQALALQADQSRRAAIPTTVPTHSPPLFVDYDNHIWIAWWGAYGSRCNGRIGDRLASVLCNTPRDAHHARQIMHATHAPLVDILFHRVPLGKIYVINKRDQESIGIKLDNECNISSVERGAPAARSGLPAVGSWAVTEINNRPLNLLKGGDEELQRISLHGTEVSILLQPSPLVKKLRAAIKANKSLLSKR